MGVFNGIITGQCTEITEYSDENETAVCNLASISLTKFVNKNKTYNFNKLYEVAYQATINLNNVIDVNYYPSKAARFSNLLHRPIGLGVQGLADVFFLTGLAYDSDGGRALAGAITSLMTGTSYRRSAEIAGIVGSYDGYARNAAAHTRVMKKHQAASLQARAVSTLDRDVWSEANKQWDSCLAIGEKSGWRNAQASVLAPTGTIGLMMDCDTTGIEPDFSLVKFKKLVGGGSMQIVNQTIPMALRKLGYTEETVEAIVEYIAANGNVVDAPGLKPEHYEIFDCAMGVRAISAMGHVKMMAATQPFLSGAISKTVNLPETATIEEIEEVYYEGWKLGLKALAVYRDNCKVGQPLSEGKGANKGTDANASASVDVDPKLTVEPAPPILTVPVTVVNNAPVAVAVEASNDAIPPAAAPIFMAFVPDVIAPPKV